MAHTIEMYRLTPDGRQLELLYQSNDTYRHVSYLDGEAIHYFADADSSNRYHLKSMDENGHIQILRPWQQHYRLLKWTNNFGVAWSLSKLGLIGVLAVGLWGGLSIDKHRQRIS